MKLREVRTSAAQVASDWLIDECTNVITSPILYIDDESHGPYMYKHIRTCQSMTSSQMLNKWVISHNKVIISDNVLHHDTS